MSELYALTVRKEVALKKLGYKVISKWDHEFRQEMTDDEDLTKFVKSVNVVSLLEPRDSFFGGRVNETRLHYKIKEGETIDYVDYTSLYPAVNKYDRYMMGHPIIILNNFKSIHLYLCSAHVAILPPRGLFHPVLPYRYDCKLLFPLCRSCAESQYTQSCTCSDAKRTLYGTYCTPELQKAVELGYAMIRIYEVYHRSESTQYDPVSKSGGLFAGYMNLF